MLQVLEQCDRASAGFRADPVHDLRVALRRCRSMADGLMAMDPEPDWKAMKKAGKRLFQSLGELRDVQIMMDWIDKLHPIVAAAPELPENPPAIGSPGSAEHISAEHLHQDSAAQALLHILQARESELKHKARAALDGFDRKQWRQWSRTLPLRAAHIRPGSVVFKHLALERWMAARELHKRAMRNRSQVALHTLRIGIKRFRYIVENFLPAEHKLWSNDLKHLQDLLGEVHDLDVLWATALAYHIFPEDISRKAWHSCIIEERTKRVEEYRAKTTGPDSLWNLWRAGLPQGEQVQQIATRRMKLWAKVLDPDFAHSERITRLSLQLYDGLIALDLLASPELTNGHADNARLTLFIAALLHDVGKSAGNKGHHKESQHLIKAHGVPLGWDPELMQRAAVVARFHAGALPTRSHKAFRDLLPPEQRLITQLAAILRLANAFDAEHDGHIQGVKVVPPFPAARSSRTTVAQNGHKRRISGFVQKPASLGKNDVLVIEAEGYQPGSSTGQTIAAERYLLETVLRHPIIVRPAKNPATRHTDLAKN